MNIIGKQLKQQNEQTKIFDEKKIEFWIFSLHRFESK